MSHTGFKLFHSCETQVLLPENQENFVAHPISKNVNFYTQNNVQVYGGEMAHDIYRYYLTPDQINVGAKTVELALREEEFNRTVPWFISAGGNWLCLEIGPNYVTSRADMVGLYPVYSRKEGTGWVLTDAPSPSTVKGSTADPAKVATALIYPIAPWQSDSDGISTEWRRQPPGTIATHLAGEKIEIQQKLDYIEYHGKCGLENVKQRLLTSVENTSRHDVGAEVSGGFDSTSLAYLLQYIRTPYIGFTGDLGSPGSKDAEFVNHLTHRSLSPEEHVWWSSKELPMPFDPDPYNSPMVFTGRINAAKMRFSAASARGHGVKILYGGHGGDELFDLLPNFLPGEFFRSPIKTTREIRKFSSDLRWSTQDSLKFLFGNRIRRKTIDSLYREAKFPPSTRKMSLNRWGIGNWHYPDWINEPQFSTAIEDEFESWRKMPARLDWRESLLSILQTSGSSTWHMKSIYAEEGITLRTPYLDESLISIVTSLNPWDLVSVSPPKKGLRVALGDIVDPIVYQRSTQDSGTETVFSGWTNNSKRLANEVPHWSLTNFSFINGEILRKFLARDINFQGQPISAARAVAVEAALRCIDEF